MPGNIISILLDDNQNSSNGQGVAENDNGLMRASNAMRFTLTLNEMQQIFPKAPADRLREVTAVLNEYMPRFGLTNMNLVAEFLGQVYVETNGLRDYVDEDGIKHYGLEEDLDYKTPERLEKVFPTLFPKNKPHDYLDNPLALGNLKYDGYWGRGLLHVSTEGNYAAFTKYMKDHYGWNIHFNDKQNRDLLTKNYIVAVLSGLWYFKTHVMDKLNMQTATVTDITKKINPYEKSPSERINPTNEALKVLKAGSLNSFPKSKLHNNTPLLKHHTTPHNIPITSPKLLTPIHIKTTGFNTTPPSIGNRNASSITQPVIQNITVNNTSNSSMSEADIHKHVADLLTAAVSDAHITTST